MKAFKVELLAIDLYEVGGKGLVKELIENYEALLTSIVNIEEKEIGEWHDDHPLNKIKTWKEEYNLVFENKFELLKEKLERDRMEYTIVDGRGMSDKYYDKCCDKLEYINEVLAFIKEK